MFRIRAFFDRKSSWGCSRRTKTSNGLVEKEKTRGGGYTRGMVKFLARAPKRFQVKKNNISPWAVPCGGREKERRGGIVEEKSIKEGGIPRRVFFDREINP